MDWYYAKDGKQAGPVSEEELSRLLRDGSIAPETLVWHAGMAEWQAYGSAIGIPPLPQRDEPRRYCSSCGNSFPVSRLAFSGDSALCPSCRVSAAQPAAVRKNVVYAGFWIRFLAWIIDGMIIGVARSILVIPLGFRLMEDHSFHSPFFWTYLGEIQLSSFAVSICYFVFFWVQYGATPGKMVLKLKVVTPGGGPISFQQAVLRYFGQILSGVILGIGFIMAGFDDQKRALHDRLANTRVIFAEENTPAGL